MPTKVLQKYGLQEDTFEIAPFGNGLINHTWKVTSVGKEYILQRVNNIVFADPDNITHNIKLIGRYLAQHYPNYCFVAPLVSHEGSEMIYVQEEGFFRMFPFIAGSHSKEIVETPEQAFEAAFQFARLTSLLCGFDAKQLRTTIPHFHDLSLRYQQFELALRMGKK